MTDVRFYSPNKNKLKAESSKMTEIKTDLGGAKFKDALILPLRRTKLSTRNVYEGGVCDQDFKFIAGYFRDTKSTIGNRSCVRSYNVDDDIAKCDDDVAFMGVYYRHFGHFLTDSLARIYSAYLLPNDIKLAFIVEPGKRVFYEDAFRLMGIQPNRVIFVDTPTQFRSVFVPDQSLYCRDAFHKSFGIPLGKIVMNASSDPDT
jgi:hypothetical protein